MSFTNIIRRKKGKISRYIYVLGVLAQTFGRQQTEAVRTKR